MGYTHYFPQLRAFTNEEWMAIREFAEKLFKHDKGIIGGTLGEPGSKPTNTKRMIGFNGIGEYAHESFIITKGKMKDYNFTKTAHKPYDVDVVAMLAYIDFIAPKALDISSDGDSYPKDEVFGEGVRLAQYLVNFAFSSRFSVTSW